MLCTLEYVLEPHSTLVLRWSSELVVHSLRLVPPVYGVRMLCVCVCSLATMQLHPEGLSTSRKDRQDANRRAESSLSRVHMYGVFHKRTLTLRGGKRVQTAHLSHWLSRRNARINSWSILWFVAVNSVMVCCGRQVGISQFCIRSHLNMRCLVCILYGVLGVE